MASRTILRPDRIGDTLTRRVLPELHSASLRLPGRKAQETEVELTRGGMLRVSFEGSPPRRGVLVLLELNTPTRCHRFHADVYGCERGWILVDMPRVLEIHQRRSSERKPPADLCLSVRYLGARVDVMTANISADGVGFLFSELDMPALEVGTKVRARIEARLGEGTPMVLEIKTLRPAPGTALTYAGAQIVKIPAQGRDWIRARTGGRAAG